MRHTLIMSCVLVGIIALHAQPRCHARTHPISDGVAPHFDNIEGKITRLNKTFAEFSININNGLWTGDEVRLNRDGVTIGSIKVMLVDETQAVGKYSSVLQPKVGDRVLFRRPRPIGDPKNPINDLIGKKATIQLTGPSNQPANSQVMVRILGIVADDDESISSIRVVSANLLTKPVQYKAGSIASISANNRLYVLDRVAQQLVTNGVLLTRVVKRQVQEELRRQELAEQKRAELARLEEERRIRQQAEKMEAERRRRDEELAAEQERRRVRDERNRPDNITVVVSRESYNFFARAAAIQIYVNDEHVGSLYNGSYKRFTIPARKDGKYKLRAQAWLSSTGGTSREFIASPGDEIVSFVGVDYALLDGSTIRSLKVFPLSHAKLRFGPPADGKEVRVAISDGKSITEYAVTSQQEIETEGWATENKYMRLQITLNPHLIPESFIVFARPGTVMELDFSAGSLNEDERIRKSIAYFDQLVWCSDHHLGDVDSDLVQRLSRMVEDSKALDSRGVLPEVVNLAEKYNLYYEELGNQASQPGLAEKIARITKEHGSQVVIDMSPETIMQAVLIGAKSLFTRTVPSEEIGQLSAAAGIEGFFLFLDKSSTDIQYAFSDSYKADQKRSKLYEEMRNAERSVVKLLTEELNKRPWLKPSSGR